ncbi:sugar transporter, putative [Bodo saltans]|uniref:Sugar transporter, putative n=1 Tax=Bodo saltans TaxID=75058 RepID=A0A0S4IUY6_BODSA|nr:sugar transporter, putative [Bodo saltans]|eukprot:CUG14084.1 sugar transporter, putative [Bodo saltans]
MLCGGLLGSSLTFAPVQAALVELDQNCTLYTAESTCSGSPKCLWHRPFGGPATEATCVFSDRVDCSSHSSSVAMCSSSHEQCVWLPSSSWCTHQAGYSGLHLLLLYGTLLFGAALGSLIAYPLLQSYGMRRSLLVCGYLSVVACAGVHASTVTDTPFILMCARGLLGVACGIASCAGPLFLSKRSPPSYQRIAGVLFHLGTTTAGVVCGFVGLVVAPRTFDSPTGMNMDARKEALATVPLVYAVALVVVGHLMPTSPGEDVDGAVVDYSHEIDDEYPQGADDAIFFSSTAFVPITDLSASASGSGVYGSLASPVGSAASQVGTTIVRSPLGSRNSPLLAATSRSHRTSITAQLPPRYLFDHARPVLVALLLAAGDQLTGFGAVMFVAPTITTTAVDASPLTGIFFLQVWCFAASVVSLLLVLRANMRNLFSVGLAFISVGCGVVAASSWQGMLADDERAARRQPIGTALFIGGYEMGVGSNFYPLSIAAQPGTIRTIAASFTMSLRFLLHTSVVALFPQATMNIFPTTTSSDLVGVQRGNGATSSAQLGLCITFAFFAAVAASCGLLVLKALPRLSA